MLWAMGISFTAALLFAPQYGKIALTPCWFRGVCAGAAEMCLVKGARMRVWRNWQTHQI
jgi:hypothetical protein